MQGDEVPPVFKDLLIAFSKLSKDPDAFQALQWESMRKQEHPLDFSLDLLWYGEHFTRKKNPRISAHVMHNIVQFCKKYDVVDLICPKLRIKVLDIAITISDGQVVKQMCQVFSVHYEREYAKGLVQDLLKTRSFKKAYHVVSALNMEQEYHIHDIVFPLFFIGDEGSVKNYLKKVPRYQEPFVRQLDDLQGDAQIREFVRLINAEGLHYQKNFVINSKFLQKRIPVFVEYFEIDIEHCPNMYNNRLSKSLRYLFHKRFSEQSIEYEPWLELTLDLVHQKPFLQYELLIKLVCTNETKLAVHIAKVLNITRSKWPSCLQSASKSIPSSEKKYKPPPELDLSDQNYLELRLERSDVHLVDNVTQLSEAIEDIVTNYDVVGVDVEWKPDMGLNLKTGFSKADLLQIAVWDSVYLIDVLTLLKLNDSSIWLPLLDKIFYNKDILKLGFGVSEDLRCLLKTIGHEKGDKVMPRIVDLNIVFEKLKKHFKEANLDICDLHPPLPTDPMNLKGLTQLCKKVLGKALNKSEQFSHWAKRPLRESQIQYAALDAFCLLMIHEATFPILKKHNLDLETIFNAQPPTPKESPKEKKKVDHKPVKTTDFRVVVDNSVRGVIKYLRMFGADVANIEEGQDNMEAVKIAQKEHRIILTGPRQYQKVIGYLPEEMCFQVDPEMNAKLQAAEVLKHYNVICEEAALLSRCMDTENSTAADLPTKMGMKHNPEPSLTSQSNQSQKVNEALKKQVSSLKYFPNSESMKKKENTYDETFIKHKMQDKNLSQKLYVHSAASHEKERSYQSFASFNKQKQETNKMEAKRCHLEKSTIRNPITQSKSCNQASIVNRGTKGPKQNLDKCKEVPCSEKETVPYRRIQGDIYEFDEYGSSDEDLNDLVCS